MKLRPEIVLFGDSLTQHSFEPSAGWGAALANHYCRKADIVLRGYEGYNSRCAVLLLPKIFPINSCVAPVAVTVFYGANDAALPGRIKEHLHVPVSEYKQNLIHIICHLKKCSKSLLTVLITPPPVDEKGRKTCARALYGENAVELPERTNETTGKYAKACVEVAVEYGVPFIDLWSKMQESTGWQEKFLSDGLHLTGEGNAFVFEELLKIFQANNLHLDNMLDDFPHHSLIDAHNPDRAFFN